jgi:ipoprotein LpqH
MTDGPQGHGWWQAADLKWYPPELHADYVAPLPPPPKLPPPPAAEPAAQQQPDDLNLAAAQEHPEAPVASPEPADRPPPDIRTPPRQPWWRQQAIVIPAALLAVVVIGVAIVITRQQHENSNGPQHREAASGAQVTLPFTGLNDPEGVAVDTAGDLYVTDLNNNRVVKLSSAGGAGSSTGTASPGAGTASGGAGTASPQHNKVLVDGQDQGAVEHVRCSTITDGLRLKIGMGDHGVVVILSDANPPAALGVQFSKTFINGGVTLEYDSRKNEGTGQVTKQGNSYKITGTATDPTQQVSKSFEINVTCP